MPQKTSINTAHAEIARDIRLAKQRMFRAHQKGTPLRQAAEVFISEVLKTVNEQDAALAAVQKHAPDHVRDHRDVGMESFKCPLECPRAEMDQPVQAGAIPIHVTFPEDEHDPESPDINAIAAHMRHSPEWERALFARRAQLEKYDLLDIQSRALDIVDNENTYSKAIRDLVERATMGSDLAALEELVTQVEQGVINDDQAKRHSESDRGPQIQNFDPRAAAKEVLGVLNCQAVDEFYNLLLFALHRNTDPLDWAAMQNVLAQMLPYTSQGLDQMQADTDRMQNVVIR